MAAKKGAAEEGRPRKGSGTQRPKKTMRPAECGKVLRRRLAAEYEEIVGAFVRVAKKGSAAHMKLATELLEKKSRPGVKRAGSAVRLLRELEERARAREGGEPSGQAPAEAGVAEEREAEEE